MSVGDQTSSDTDASPRSSAKEPIRADPVSAVAGLVFIAVALVALADSFSADVDGWLVAGAAVAAVGVAMIVSMTLRHHRRREK